MAGISNFTIEKFINEIDDELKKNFIGVFPSDKTLKFLKITEMVRKKKSKYPFMIMNTDRSGQGGTHWWSFLEIASKDKIFLFDSYGFIGLKEFIIDNDRKTLDKFFYGLDKMNRNDKRINLTYVQFDLENYLCADKSKLTNTANDFFYTLFEFGRVHNESVVDIFMVDDPLQDEKSDTCGIFQLYFYTNLFLPQENSKIIKNRQITMRTISTLLNEFFTLDINGNESRVEAFAKDLNIKRN